MSEQAQPELWVREALTAGQVIPAHPLALTSQGQFDPPCQRALTRYYAAAGAGGVAVGVHTTQFEIRKAGIDLLEPVLRCAADALDEIQRTGGPRLVRIAGVCGPTPQALAEAGLARDLGYHVALVSLTALNAEPLDALLRHCEAVAEVMPIMGFYLQRGIGGRRLGFEFWRRLAEVPNLVAVKIAPFNRYETLEAVRGIAASGRSRHVALYTGNDDNIVADLLTPLDTQVDGRAVRQRIVGGLLGHWAVWTHAAVGTFRRVQPRRAGVAGGDWVDPELLALGAQVTEANAAVFDAAHDFAGVIAGVQHVLWGQGLLRSPRCLDEAQTLSAGQADEIERVRRDWPHLTDDDFVAKHLREWLS